jgi:hypothetical protein
VLQARQRHEVVGFARPGAHGSISTRVTPAGSVSTVTAYSEKSRAGSALSRRCTFTRSKSLCAGAFPSSLACSNTMSLATVREERGKDLPH